MSNTEPPDYDDVDGPDSGKVLVFRNGANEPIAVPSEVVTAAERAYRCHMLRVQGLSWHAIAEAEGYPSASAAQYDVERYLEEAKALVVERSARQMLTLEVSRLDAVQAALWPQAMKGHVPSAQAVVGIIINRAKLVGLDPEKMNEDAAAQARTVVVPSNDDGYLAALKSAAGDQPTEG